MVWWLHCAWISLAWSTALDAGADFTSALHRSRRSVSSEIVAPQIAGARRAGAGRRLLCRTPCKSTQRRHANVGKRLAGCTTYRLSKASLDLASPGRALGCEESANMHIQAESEFVRTPVLENCVSFSYVQYGYCGYLILGGSAKELLHEEKRHAVECKATHRLDRRKKPEGPRAEAPGSGEHTHSDLEYGSIDSDCEAVISVRNIVMFWSIAISFFLLWAAFTSSGPSLK